jgi:hypothetical protein
VQSITLEERDFSSRNGGLQTMASSLQSQHSSSLILKENKHVNAMNTMHVKKT